MAWTSPITYSVGQVLTAAIMNAHVRDNTTFLHDRLQQLTNTGGSLTMTTLGTYYTGASLSVPAGAWLLIATVQFTPTNSTDKLTPRLRNTTDSTTLVAVSTLQGGSFTKEAVSPAVYASLAATKTIEAQATNETTNGGTIDSTELVAIGAAA